MNEKIVDNVKIRLYMIKFIKYYMNLRSYIYTKSVQPLIQQHNHVNETRLHIHMCNILEISHS